MIVTREKDSSSDGTSGGDSSSGRSIIISPGTPKLRRVTTGDFDDTPQHGGDDYSYSSSHRMYRYYDSDSKLIDDHILVLYSDYWYGFEAFDLNTGKALEQVGGMNGPDKDYVNTEEHRISLGLTHYDGRHGLLAAGLDLYCRPSSNPHGPWSGPYLTVWDLGVDDYHKNIRMRLDLHKPLYSVVAVSVVAPNKCAVLLKSAYDPISSNDDDRSFDQENIVDDDTTAVILQWHRIPLNGDEMSSDPSPPPPPTPPVGGEPKHHCSMSCMMSCREGDKSRIWRRQKELWDKHMESQNNGTTRSNQDNDDDDDVIEYKWFPGSTTLLQEGNISQTLPPNNCACMHSDGKGILVVMAGQEVQFWHVGTMSLVRCCNPFEGDSLDFSPNIIVTNFTSCTIVAPKDMEDGESYEEELSREQQQQQQQQQQQPQQQQQQQQPQEAKRPKLHEKEQQHDDLPGTASEKGSHPRQTATAAIAQPGSVRNSNFDLARCDTESILRRFAHETSKQEREFEQGICGILGPPNDDGSSLIKRSTRLPVGSCSPQLECVVRVAFSIRYQSNDHINQIVVMDVEPFSSIRYRYQDGEHYYLEEYAQACLGQKGLWTTWDTNFNPSSDNSCEQIRVFDWFRGGVLDFPEHGETESKRLDRYVPLISNTSGAERERLVGKMRAIEELKGPDRAPLSLRIDVHKLIVCTKHEVSIWPTEIYREINGYSRVLLRGCDDLLRMGDRDDDDPFPFQIDVETKPLYSARPMDRQFCNRWDEIAYAVNRASEGDGESHSDECYGTYR